MKSLPFYLIEDLVDAEAGDLSPGADTRIRSQVRRLRVQFAREEVQTVPVRRQSKRVLNRIKSLLPGGVPRYVRCYDDGVSHERYTVCFTGSYQRHLWKDGKLTELRPGYQGRLEHFRRPSRFLYMGLTAGGMVSHGEHDRPIDANRSGFAPEIGRKNHLGRRIPFSALPPDCQRLVLADYRELWGLKS